MHVLCALSRSRISSATKFWCPGWCTHWFGKQNRLSTPNMSWTCSECLLDNIFLKNGCRQSRHMKLSPELRICQGWWVYWFSSIGWYLYLKHALLYTSTYHVNMVGCIENMVCNASFAICTGWSKDNYPLE